MAPPAITITRTDGKQLTLSFSDKTLFVKHTHSGKKAKKPQEWQAPLRQVIRAAAVQPTGRESALDVTLLVKKGVSFKLTNVQGRVKDEDKAAAVEWADALTEAAYEGVRRARRLKVLINPFGGQGKGGSIFKKKVEPLLRAAGCILDVTFTTHKNHALEIGREIDIDSYDAVVTLSGDGLVHEVLNGFAQHQHPLKAFDIPIAPIPTGSGNGLSVNLLGTEEGFDVLAAALNAVKGRIMRVDLFSFVQGGNRTFSFMTQATGLMADLDLGTEHLRWMGSGRFIYGLLRGMVRFKPCPVELSIKVAEDDKVKMADALRRQHQLRDHDVPPTPMMPPASDRLPELAHVEDDGSEPGWITFDKPLLFAYAGKGPYVSRDFMVFPVSLPDDGLVDIVVHEQTSRVDIVKSIDGAEKGSPYWKPSMRYWKAHAYRIRPLAPKGFLSIDGEAFPYTEYHVEAHKSMACVLSPHGYYAGDMPPTPVGMAKAKAKAKAVEP